MTVAGVTELEREAREVAFSLLEPLERHAQPDLVSIGVQREPRRAPERAAQMEHRHTNGGGNPGQREALRHSRSNPPLCGIGKVRGVRQTWARRSRARAIRQ